MLVTYNVPNDIVRAGLQSLAVLLNLSYDHLRKLGKFSFAFPGLVARALGIKLQNSICELRLADIVDLALEKSEETRISRSRRVRHRVERVRLVHTLLAVPARH